MKRAARIWLVTIGEPLPIQPNSRALRTRLLARELASRGHEVLWWTSRFDHFNKSHFDTAAQSEDSGEGYRIFYLDGIAYRRNLSVARQINHLQIAADFKRKAWTMARPDVVVCSFPPIELTEAVSRYAASCGAMFIADVRDLWPDEMRARVPTHFRPLARPVFGLLERTVRRSLSRAGTLVGVSQRYLQWALDRTPGFPVDRAYVIPLGYPDHPMSKEMRAGAWTKRFEGPLKLFFCGSFNNSVDVPTLIASMRMLRHRDISATICGGGEHEAHWRHLASGDERITFTGWIDGDEIRRYAALAHVGVVCYRPGSYVAMPNKLFEYMSFGLPVLNSITGEAAALVADSGIGYNYSAGDAKSLAGRIEMMVERPGETARMSVRSAGLFDTKFESGSIYGSYADLIESLTDRARVSGVRDGKH